MSKSDENNRTKKKKVTVVCKYPLWNKRDLLENRLTLKPRYSIISRALKLKSGSLWNRLKNVGISWVTLCEELVSSPSNSSSVIRPSFSASSIRSSGFRSRSEYGAVRCRQLLNSRNKNTNNISQSSCFTLKSLKSLKSLRAQSELVIRIDNSRRQLELTNTLPIFGKELQLNEVRRRSESELQKELLKKSSRRS